MHPVICSTREEANQSAWSNTLRRLHAQTCMPFNTLYVLVKLAAQKQPYAAALGPGKVIQACYCSHPIIRPRTCNACMKSVLHPTWSLLPSTGHSGPQTHIRMDTIETAVQRVPSHAFHTEEPHLLLACKGEVRSHLIPINHPQGITARPYTHMYDLLLRVTSLTVPPRPGHGEICEADPS